MSRVILFLKAPFNIDFCVISNSPKAFLNLNRLLLQAMSLDTKESCATFIYFGGNLYLITTLYRQFYNVFSEKGCSWENRDLKIAFKVKITKRSF